jgi:RNA polymerase sigma-70 factor (ECF subfamily)
LATEPKTGIIDRARSGDGEAFAALFEAHGDEVLRVCRRMLGGPEPAVDARSEVFLKARRALDGYDPARSFRTWLLSIASHHCIDQLRRAATERRVFADTALEPGELEGPEPSPLSRLLAREKHAALDRAIEALPIEYRLPLLMRYYAEASYDEIAERLGTTRSRVGTLIFRAKRRLRERMSAPVADGGATSSPATTDEDEAGP